MLILLTLVLLFWITRIPHFFPSNLRDLPELPESGEKKRVSVIVAARDEAAGIEAAVRSLLLQNPYELVVVNDRSRDGTGEILDRLVAAETQLQVVHIQELPPGWLGKCWALEQGARRASGDWILFCDGDVILRQGAIDLAAAVAEKEGLAHLALAARLISRNVAQEAVISTLSFLFFLFQNPGAVRKKDKLRSYMGIGAFNMIRRSVYQEIGGHAALRLEIIDDVFLGMLVKRYKHPSMFFLGHNWVQIHWYPNLWGYVRGLEKNVFAGLRFSWLLLIVGILLQALLFYLPTYALFATEGLPFLLGLLSFLLMHGLLIESCRRQDIRWYYALPLQIAMLVQYFTFVRSGWITTRQKGVRWRDNFYALEDLKAAQKVLRGPL